MYLQTDDRSKVARRKAVTSRFNVLAYFGDNLDDFSSEFETSTAPTSEERLRRVCALRKHFGTDWFVLPNPLYGTWQSLAGEPGEERLACP